MLRSAANTTIEGVSSSLDGTRPPLPKGAVTDVAINWIASVLHRGLRRLLEPAIGRCCRQGSPDTPTRWKAPFDPEMARQLLLSPSMRISQE